jgi:uncharacterized membrane protein
MVLFVLVNDVYPGFVFAFTYGINRIRTIIRIIEFVYRWMVVSFGFGDVFFILLFDTLEFMGNDCVNAPGIIYIFVVIHFVQHSYMLNIVVIVVIIKSSSRFQKTVTILLSLMLPILIVTFEHDLSRTGFKKLTEIPHFFAHEFLVSDDLFERTDLIHLFGK